MTAILKNNVDQKKRRNLIIATAAVSGVAGAAVAIPFAFSMKPSARAIAAGAATLDYSPYTRNDCATEEKRRTAG
jgi:Rieske Fe-S protein